MAFFFYLHILSLSFFFHFHIFSSILSFSRVFHSILIPSFFLTLSQLCFFFTFIFAIVCPHINLCPPFPPYYVHILTINAGQDNIFSKRPSIFLLHIGHGICKLKNNPILSSF
ncbi:unnamed protein product [Meloidogyne enterolobii]|uniref:Uncharacterized protein n=1 Tax=Meloidogyne enterolobii TaxID=390850 RepID=A0ACB1B154_MELEN